MSAALLRTMDALPDGTTAPAALLPKQAKPVSLCDTLDRLLKTGAVILGEATLSVAEVDLISLKLQVVLASAETLRSPHGDTPSGPRIRTPEPRREASAVLGVFPAVSPSAPLTGTPLPLSPAVGPKQDGMQDRTFAKKPEPGARQAAASLDSRSRGLTGLVLTLVKLLHELLERQAVQRMEGGSLTDGQVERLGVALMRQAEELDRLREEFGLTEEDLNLDLGPLGKVF